jgi:peptide/nickel transport system substrate-binding protein
MLEKLQNAYTELVTIVDEQERYAKLLDAYQIHIDEGPISIGTVGEHPSPVIVKNNFHNVPPTGLTASWDLGYPGSADPEQFFISTGQ